MGFVVLFFGFFLGGKAKRKRNKICSYSPSPQYIPLVHHLQVALYPLHYFLRIIANKGGINFNIFLNNHLKTDGDLSHRNGLAKQPVFSLVLAPRSGEADSLSAHLIRECFLQICVAIYL